MSAVPEPPRTRRTAAVALAACLLGPLPLAAQIRASEAGLVAQTIDGTRLILEYSRPRARGRETLFGRHDMSWGHTWTPGANWATTLEVDKDIKLNGHAVRKGKYSVWMVVRKDEPWTLVLDPKAHRFHMDPPDSSAQQVRFAARAEQGAFTEVLTWSMPELRANGGTLVMQWERVRVPLDVQVEPSLVSTLPAADAASLVGTYSWTELDSAGKAKDTSTLTISHEEGTLKGRWTPEDGYFKKFALIRIAPDWFVPGIYDKSGHIYEVLKPDLVFEFTRANGRAASIVAREEDDHVSGTGTRRP